MRGAATYSTAHITGSTLPRAAGRRTGNGRLGAATAQRWAGSAITTDIERKHPACLWLDVPHVIASPLCRAGSSSTTGCLQDGHHGRQGHQIPAGESGGVDELAAGGDF